MKKVSAILITMTMVFLSATNIHLNKHHPTELSDNESMSVFGNSGNYSVEVLTETDANNRNRYMTFTKTDNSVKIMSFDDKIDAWIAREFIDEKWTNTVLPQNNSGIQSIEYFVTDFGFFFVEYHRFLSANCSNNFYHQFTIRNLSANNSIYSIDGFCGVGTEGIHVLSDGVSTTKNSFSFASFVCKNEPGQWAAPIYKDSILTFFSNQSSIVNSVSNGRYGVASYTTCDTSSALTESPPKMVSTENISCMDLWGNKNGGHTSGGNWARLYCFNYANNSEALNLQHYTITNGNTCGFTMGCSGPIYSISNESIIIHERNDLYGDSVTEQVIIVNLSGIHTFQNQWSPEVCYDTFPNLIESFFLCSDSSWNVSVKWDPLHNSTHYVPGQANGDSGAPIISFKSGNVGAHHHWIYSKYNALGGLDLNILWSDYDQDSFHDLVDDLPEESTQFSDIDGDGYGDSITGIQFDVCPNQYGNSTIDVFGCRDSDGDGWSDTSDLFPLNNLSWSDSDGDDFPDQGRDGELDDCPLQRGESFRNDTLGCPDFDYDGWANMDDDFDNDASQWIDSDSDGFGDNLIGFQGDACPDDYGKSWMDVFGCTDSDHDGWSDEGDAFPYELTQWSDRDFDGYGDNQSQGANLVDAFPGDTTQWNDSDGDGFGDNPFGNSADRFPDNPLRWQDSDHDSVADQDDPFPDDASQSVDSDGDGYGDDINGSFADAFPDDPTEWKDSDADGYGDNSDDFPFDPTQIEDRDGDGMGDNPMGIGADKFPDDNTQWGDIDGDGYGDNPSGNDPDAFITDATQWFDADGDGYGDNPSGRLADAFPNNPTQWIDEDGDGLGDNQSGTDGDPYLNDFDNDGYNDSIDLLPKLASPGDLDADGCLDEEDIFPDNPRECNDSDNDGVGDNEDADDDNDGWTDTEEIRLGTNSLSSAEKPVDSFEIVLPRTAIGLGAWDLIGIFGGVPIFSWLLFGFATRNGRTARIEERMRQARSREELEEVTLHSEFLLMLRLIGPHQGIRLERIRAELDNELTSSGPLDEFATPEPDFSLQTSKPFASEPAEKVENGYEWLTKDGVTYYRLANSQSEWTPYQT